MCSIQTRHAAVVSIWYCKMQWVCVTAREVNVSKISKEAEDFNEGLGHLGVYIFDSAFMVRLVVYST